MQIRDLKKYLDQTLSLSLTPPPPLTPLKSNCVKDLHLYAKILLHLTSRNAYTVKYLSKYLTG